VNAVPVDEPTMVVALVLPLVSAVGAASFAMVAVAFGPSCPGVTGVFPFSLFLLVGQVVFKVVVLLHPLQGVALVPVFSIL
jgi:hypothetical protein